MCGLTITCGVGRRSGSPIEVKCGRRIRQRVPRPQLNSLRIRFWCTLLPFAINVHRWKSRRTPVKRGKSLLLPHRFPAAKTISLRRGYNLISWVWTDVSSSESQTSWAHVVHISITDQSWRMCGKTQAPGEKALLSMFRPASDITTQLRIGYPLCGRLRSESNFHAIERSQSNLSDLRY